MTNTDFLKERIDKSGYKLKFIVAELGITHQGFLNKLNNKSEFKASEIKELCKLLNIDIQQKEVIFFAESGDCKSTKQKDKNSA